MTQLINVFPLSIYRDRLQMPESYRRELVARVLEMERRSHVDKPAHSAWLGDTSGFEFLYQFAEFEPLYRAIHTKLRDYLEALGIDSQLVKLYFQRSWATITRHAEHINEHSHEQSNISIAYYLRKPLNSGGIHFTTYAHPNEFARGIFTPSKAKLGFIKRPSIATWNTVYLEPEEDDIVIFPSKTLHSTAPNETHLERISISADVSTVLRESSSHETMMPDICHWRSFDA